MSVEARVMFGEIEIRSMSKFSPITSSHQTSISLQYDAWKVSNKELQDGKFDLRYVSSFSTKICDVRSFSRGMSGQ